MKLYFMIVYMFCKPKISIISQNRGLATPLVTVAFNNAVTFGAYGHAMKIIPDSKAKDVLAGLYAGTWRAIFISPIGAIHFKAFTWYKFWNFNFYKKARQLIATLNQNNSERDIFLP